ncbi:ABC transporter permease [Terracidiphilus gabretensis]|jgi:putative ABC transport system permease protein|uniref:ABC transporter permease n=1 Tax=Terracidiphilus gabretensis TaxID=1577687 RepID=UPI00071BB5A8|nr:ABC transporter permease [Terracidiphilus gabretensis]
MNTLMQDVRFALRQLRKSPGFTLTVVVTLALGIGANAAIFTLFDQALLRMLPVDKPKELVRFEWTGAFNGSESSFGGDPDNYFSYPMYKDLKEKNQVFTDILATDRVGAGLSWHNQAEARDGETVSGNYFQLLGLHPAAGRLFTSQDETAKDANPVVVLGNEYWKGRFGSSRDVVGQTLMINGRAFEIVGVAPEGFDSAIGGFKPAFFIPVTMLYTVHPWRGLRDDLKNHQAIYLTLVARLKPGVTREQAEASLAPLWHSLRAYELTLYKEHSERFAKHFVDESKLKVIDDSQGFSPNRGDLKTPLIVLMSMAGLLVAMCAINVATLLLLRASARAREMAMRYALGAKRGRIAAQLLIEGGLIGLVGAVAGLLLAPTVAHVLVSLITSADPGSEPYSAHIDGRILLFTLAIALVASVLFSIAPVLHFLKPNLAATLRQNSGTATKDSQRFRKIAVGVQIALSVMLLGGAGLFVRTLDNLRNTNVGFAPDHLLEFSLDPGSSGYADSHVSRSVQDSIEALRRIPGVISVAATTDPELSGDGTTNGFQVQGYKAGPDENLGMESPQVTPGYFATIKQPLLVGREFTDADRVGQPKAAIVNLTMAKKYFGSPQNAIGRQITDGDPEKDGWSTIVGVVGDSKHLDLRTLLKSAVYQPYFADEHPNGVEMYLRTTGDPKKAESAVRQTIHALDAALVVDGLRTMEEQMDQVASHEVALAYLAMGFSALALLMATVGLYGVLAYSTEQRTREIGVRLALGAQRSSVITLVLREMVIIAVIATAVALPSIVMLARLLKSQLFEVTPADPVTLMGAVAVTMGMVALAALLPARRAAAVEPMRALRTE